MHGGERSRLGTELTKQAPHVRQICKRGKGEVCLLQSAWTGSEGEVWEERHLDGSVHLHYLYISSFLGINITVVNIWKSTNGRC